MAEPSMGGVDVSKLFTDYNASYAEPGMERSPFDTDDPYAAGKRPQADLRPEDMEMPDPRSPLARAPIPMDSRMEALADLGNARLEFEQSDPRLSSPLKAGSGELDGLLASLQGIRQANANARAGKNDVPRGGSTVPEGLPDLLAQAGKLGPQPGAHAEAMRSRAGSSGGMSMARPISMEDDRRRDALVGLRAGQAPVPQDTGDLEERALAAKQRLVGDPSRGLSMNDSGAVVGSGGTPVDKQKQLAAQVARASQQAERMGTLKKNRQLKAAGMREIPLPPGMDPMMFGMPPQQLAQLLAARENNAAAGKRADADREVTRMGVEGTNRYHDSMAKAANQKAANEAEMNKFATSPQGIETKLAMEGALGDPSTQAFLRKMQQQQGGGGGVAVPADQQASMLDQFFRDMDVKGVSSPQEFRAEAEKRGISPAMLQQWAADNQNSHPVHRLLRIANTLGINQLKPGMNKHQVPAMMWPGNEAKINAIDNRIKMIRG